MSRMPTSPSVPVARYLRMSTDQQQYSLDNQSDAIQRYADQHNMTVVHTYSDAAKSGLTLSQRPGLRQLLEDVERGSPGYSAVLVYDVSRWGRFQDADESAFYEYRCRRAKIAVHYCAETFSNDGGITAALLKAVKRAMAAEYSRELSVKVFTGQARLTELGFRQGGKAGYGYRRLLVDQDGKPKFVLKEGQEKSISTDRVILIPGPPEEGKVVREIFRLYISKRYSPAAIAAVLNKRDVPWVDGAKWTRYVIRDMVTNPKYLGSNVSNRRSGKLQSRRMWNPPELWIRCDGAFPGLIDAKLFQQAQDVATRRIRTYSNERLLQYLRDFLRKKGRLTARMIRNDVEMPCPQIYSSRFGGLKRAYEIIGYEPTRNLTHFERDRHLKPARRNFTQLVIDEFRRMGIPVIQDSRTKLLILNGRLRIRVSATRCRPLGKSHGWLLRLHSPTKPDVNVIARLEPGNEKLQDYFCIPGGRLRGLKQITMRPGSKSVFDQYWCGDLTFLSSLVGLSNEESR
jgi:DNA invertase Pin-like site-specific DNA recombinase